VTDGRIAAESLWATATLKVLGLAGLLIVLLSVDYTGLTISKTLLELPLQLVFVGSADAVLLSYFVVSSRWTGWKEWGAVFALLYGVNYVLVAMESVYMGSIFPPGAVSDLLVNGAIRSGVFAGALVLVAGKKGASTARQGTRLAMPTREWAWKIVGSGAAYLLLFVLFGFAVYMPLANALNPKALVAEQSVVASSPGLIFPLEMLRGTLWAILAVPAVAALRFGWKKTGPVVGLLFALPMSGSVLMSTTTPPGLQVAHLVEVFAENFVFGLLVVWVLHLRSRLPVVGDAP